MFCLDVVWAAGLQKRQRVQLVILGDGGDDATVWGVVGTVLYVLVTSAFVGFSGGAAGQRLELLS